VVTLTIDGCQVRVSEGTNLVEAAKNLGIEIPTYCYHPGLTVVGQCRICFVEIEGMPRLVTACSTPAQENMVVLTDSDRVREARAAIMEFLLENHPLDCPVCDQAGECGLQDYSVEHGLDTTHMIDERRTYPGYERRLIGPHVVQNQNRCIHCTRCIRVTTEISETADLTMKSRGNHSFIDTFDGQPLDNPWSACVADVCPVGALTVKDFRFRAREAPSPHPSPEPRALPPPPPVPTPLPPPEEPEARTQEDPVLSCFTHCQKGDFDRVIACCARAHEDPARIEAEEEGALFAIEGIAQMAIGRVDEALQALERATCLLPCSWVAHFHRGQALYETGKVAPALVAFERALRILRRPMDVPLDDLFLGGFPPGQMARVCQARIDLCRRAHSH